MVPPLRKVNYETKWPAYVCEGYEVIKWCVYYAYCKFLNDHIKKKKNIAKKL